jgi:hypothetical protein
MSRQKRAELARKNLDKRLALIREANHLRPAGGWIRAIREALGMTTRQLAQLSVVRTFGATRGVN